MSGDGQQLLRLERVAEGRHLGVAEAAPDVRPAFAGRVAVHLAVEAGVALRYELHLLFDVGEGLQDLAFGELAADTATSRTAVAAGALGAEHLGTEVELAHLVGSGGVRLWA